MQPQPNGTPSVSPASRYGSDRLQTTARALLVTLVALLTVTSGSLVFVTPAAGATTHAPTVAGGGDLAGCAVITGPGTYRLTGDVTDSAATVCIDIQSSDVTVDGGGFVLDGVSAPGSVGIRADGSAGALTNVTVRNVVVTEWADGLRYDDADASIVESARFERNGNGTVLVDVSNAVVRDLDVVGTANRGVSLETTAASPTDGDNRLSDLRITGTGLAIWSDLPRTTVEDVVADGDIVLRGLDNVASSITANRFVGGAGTTLTDAALGTVALRGDGQRLDGVSVDGNELTGPITGYPGIIVSDSDDSVLRNVTVVNTQREGILFTTSSVGVSSVNNTLSDVSVENATTGITLRGVGDTTLTNVRITDTGTGIAVNNYNDRSSGVSLQNVTVARSASNGIRFFFTANNVFTNVSVSDSGEYGINFYGLGRNSLTDVSVVGSGRDGIFVQNLNDFDPSLRGGNVLRDVTVSRNDQNGVSVQGRNEQVTVPDTFSGITATDNGASGIFTFYSSRNTITDVTATGNRGGGILLRNSGNQTVTDSFVADNGFGLAVIDTDGATVERVTALNNTGLIDLAVLRSTNTTVTDLQLSSARLSFTGSGFGFNGVESPPAPPDGLLGIGSAFETRAFESAPIADVAVAYTDDDVTDAGVAESTLALFQYDDTGTAWGELPGSAVDTTDNVVRATITEAAVYGAFGEPAEDTVEVTIDVTPGEEPNAINPNARGVIPVAILNTTEYDVRDIDVSTLRFGATDVVEAGGGAAPASGGHLEDVDGDGDLDLVVQVPTTDTGFVAGDTEALLVGEFTDGTALFGADTVTIVGRAAATVPNPVMTWG